MRWPICVVGLGHGTPCLLSPTREQLLARGNDVGREPGVRREIGDPHHFLESICFAPCACMAFALTSCGLVFVGSCTVLIFMPVTSARRHAEKEKTVIESQARSAGKALLKRMKGQGWKLNVWENMGWHYSVGLDVPGGYLRVSPMCSSNKYMVMFNNRYAGAGEMCWTDHGNDDKDPNKAASNQLKVAERWLKQYLSAVNALKRNIRKGKK